MDTARNPLLAAVYDLVMKPMESLGLAGQRARTAGAARGRVLEIAAGTGAMFRHYPPEEVEGVVATEPDPDMLRRARGRAQDAPVPVELQLADAQALPFEDQSFDTVLVALSLCTIPDPVAALSEARRVLRPDGRLVFLEHVRSRRGWVASLQHALTPVWRQVAGGCHLDRDTVSAIERAGFEIERLWRSGDERGSMVQGEARPST
ncbi:MAG: methyltransferase domain-containing protein [Nitriliruptorales bacterium]|nr:methyltransferase domain-containing protein [Nitriliruptorales bacterium]